MLLFTAPHGHRPRRAQPAVRGVPRDDERRAARVPGVGRARSRRTSSGSGWSPPGVNRLRHPRLRNYPSRGPLLRVRAPTAVVHLVLLELSVPTTLTLTDLDVAHGARTLVCGLDLVLAPGDVTALVGPNGSGKSSLMRTLVGRAAAGVWLDPARSGRRHHRLAAPGAARPGGDPAGLRRRRHRRRAARPRPARGVRRPAPTAARRRDAYAAALEHWLALGAADLEDRLPRSLRRSVSTSPSTARSARFPAGRPPGPPWCDPAQPLRRAAARRADQQPRRPRARADVGLRDRPRRPGPPREPRPRPSSTRSPRASSSSTSAQQRIGHYTGGYSAFVEARALERRRAHEAFEEYAETRDHLVAQSRQRADWAAQGRAQRARRRRARTSTSARSTAPGPRPQAAKAAPTPAVGRPARRGRPAPQGVGAALPDRRRAALRRCRRGPSTGSMVAWRLPPRPDRPHARRATGSRSPATTARQDHAAGRAARARCRSPRAGHARDRGCASA